MNNLVEEYFEVETPKGSFQAKYVSPIWAKGFDCKPMSCGLCCITALPEGVPHKTFELFGNKICVYYNTQRRVCKAYEKRPWGCKTYPFFLGVENGQVIVSHSLECPSTNTSYINMDILRNTFRYPKVAFAVDYLNDVFNEAKRSKFGIRLKNFGFF